LPEFAAASSSSRGSDAVKLLFYTRGTTTSARAATL